MPAKRPASKVCKRPAAKHGKGGVEPKKKEAMEDDGIFPSSDSDGGKSQYQRVKDVMFFSDIFEV